VEPQHIEGYFDGMKNTGIRLLNISCNFLRTSLRRKKIRNDLKYFFPVFWNCCNAPANPQHLMVVRTKDYYLKSVL